MDRPKTESSVTIKNCLFTVIILQSKKIGKHLGCFPIWHLCGVAVEPMLTASIRFNAIAPVRDLLFLPKTTRKDFIVHSENDDHGHTAGNHCGDNALERVAQGRVADQCVGDWIPHAGEQVHHQEYSNGGDAVGGNLDAQRAVALEGHVALEGEVDALAETDGYQIGQRERQAAGDDAVDLLQGVADDGQVEVHTEQGHRDVGPQPFGIAHHTAEQVGQEHEQQRLEECHKIAEQEEQAPLANPFGQLRVLFTKSVPPIF